MKLVNWSFITSHEWDTDHLSCIRPLVDVAVHPYEHLSKEIATTRKGSTFLKCPAHTDFLKNTFVFLAPFDVTLDINITNTDRSILSENLSQAVFDNLIDTRFLEDYDSQTNPYPLIGIDWLNIFTCNDSLFLQVLPAFMHHTEFSKSATVIPGEFDIGKWTRPVEIVFEVKSNQEKIVINKGDAVAYFKFNTDQLIKLVPASTPWSEIKLCNSIRQENAFRPLKERYEELKDKKITRCPHESKD
jgi:hypothetical protein